MRQEAEVVVGLRFGDEGKGATVASKARARKPRLVFRWNGGHQAAHNVVTQAGEHHCFHGFGSHTLEHPDVPTYLGPQVLFDPWMALQEHRELQGRGKLLVDYRALVVTPWHIAMNQLRETLRSGSRHGSCGMGIGEVRGDVAAGLPAIQALDLRNPNLKVVWREIADAKRTEARALLSQSLLKFEDLPGMARLLLLPDDAVETVWNNWSGAVHQGTTGTWQLAEPSVFQGSEYVLGEGAQGILLDEWVGFHPHTTWTDCTPAPAVHLLEEAGLARPRVVGVTRAYDSRHGAGPFPSELKDGDARLLEGEHNDTGPWQGQFRVGLADMPLLRYALKAIGPLDELWIRHLDRVANPRALLRYGPGVEDQLLPPSRTLPEEEALAASSKLTALLSGPLCDPANVGTFDTPIDLALFIRALVNCPDGTNCFGPEE